MKKMHRGYFHELEGFNRGIQAVIRSAPPVERITKNGPDAKAAAEAKRLRKMAKRAKEVKS